MRRMPLRLSEMTKEKIARKKEFRLISLQKRGNWYLECCWPSVTNPASHCKNVQSMAHLIVPSRRDDCIARNRPELSAQAKSVVTAECIVCDESGRL